jgi:hypothetical protein
MTSTLDSGSGRESSLVVNAAKPSAPYQGSHVALNGLCGSSPRLTTVTGRSADIPSTQLTVLKVLARIVPFFGIMMSSNPHVRN